MASAIYKSIITVADKVVPKKFEPLWQHPAGIFIILTVILKIFIPMYFFFAISQVLKLYFFGHLCVNG